MRYPHNTPQKTKQNNLNEIKRKMRTQRTTLSFLTESKASHASLSFIRRVAITLLVMLLTTASVWAQEVEGGTSKISTKVTPENCGTVSAPTEAKRGTQVQFTVTPAPGYKIKKLNLDDPQISYTLVYATQKEDIFNGVIVFLCRYEREQSLVSWILGFISLQYTLRCFI